MYVKARIDRDTVIWLVVIYVAPKKKRALRVKKLEQFVGLIYISKRTLQMSSYVVISTSTY